MVFNQQGNTIGNNKNKKNGKGKNLDNPTKVFEDLEDGMELNNEKEDEQEYPIDEDEESVKDNILDEDDTLELDGFLIFIN